MAGDDADLDSVIAAARQKSPGRGGRSPVYGLMWDNHARLAPELNHPRRPNWDAMAQVLGSQGVLDGAGQVLTATSGQTIRKTWWKVCRDKEAVAVGTTRRRSKAKPGQGAASSPAVAAPVGGHGMLPPGIEPPEEAAPRYTFKFASVKDWTKVADKGEEVEI